MIKHIVMFTLKDHAHGNSKQQNAALIKQQLEALMGQIPGLLKMEVGLDFSAGADSADLVLYSEFVDRDALAGYLEHPAHQAIVPFVREARAERRLVDYCI
jgi:hypothetical protein